MTSCGLCRKPISPPRSARRVLVFAGRADMRRGWLCKRCADGLTKGWRR